MLEHRISKTKALALLTIAAATVSTAQAATTHLLQATAAAHVTLVTKDAPGQPANICPFAGFAGMSFFRVGMDGTSGTAPFVVPRGYALVITDLEWQARGGLQNSAPFTANVGLHMDIALVKTVAGAAANVVYSSPTIDVDANHVGAVLGATDDMTAGFTVGPGVAICPATFQYDSSTVIAVKTSRVVLHGYLVATP